MFGVLIFDRVPPATSIAGSVLIVLSCVLISLHRREPAGSRGGLDALPPKG